MKMQDWPTISIVIPVYNSEEYLPAALDSIIDQSYQNYEIILVDNASSGNVGEIFETYKKMYPAYEWKLLHIEKNRGPYYARLAGFQAMTGEYFTSMDSDDVMSVDYYYQLLKQALETGSDIVMTDYVHSYPDGHMDHYALNPMELSDICWENGDALKHFFEFHGGCFNLHALWNKVMHRSIFDKSRKHLEKVHAEFRQCDDVLFSAVFYYYSKRVTNIHHVYYYHTIRSDSGSMTLAASIPKMEDSFRGNHIAFQEIEEFLKDVNLLDAMKEGLDNYNRAFVSILFSCLHSSGFPKSEIRRIEKQALELYDMDKPYLYNPKEWLFESLRSPFNNMRERAMAQIRDKEVKCVSFDIFDTLIERPFLRPDDTFEFLSMEYNRRYGGTLYVDFAQLRRDAERRARDRLHQKHPSYADVRLPEIYDELVDSGVLTEGQADELMRKEVELELRFCKRRQVGYDLYDFAKRCGKKVICVSDMYLPEDVIREILRENGYGDIEDVFISGMERACKYDRRLFEHVLKKTGLQAKEVAHFGDNYISDFVAPRDAGIHSVLEITFIPSAREMMTDRCGLAYAGNLFDRIFGTVENPFSSQNYLGIRCMIGVAQNRVYSNPYIAYAPESSFNADPIYMGYFALGMYIFAVAKWLLDKTRERGYDTIHFIARDGYLIKQVYDILATHTKGKCPKSNYLYTSRSAMIPLMINHPSDILAMPSMTDIYAYTPLLLLEHLKPVIPEEKFRRREAILKKADILDKQKFRSLDEWTVFAELFQEEFYDPQTIKTYRDAMRKQFAAIVGPNDCTFDVGYSARTESIMKDLLGYPLDAFYLFCNVERGLLQAKYADVRMELFHKSTVEVVVDRVLECFISTTDPSCRDYSIKDGKLCYEFDKEQFEFQTRFILHRIQDEALCFVRDFVNTFPEEWETMQYRFADRPFMHLMANSTHFDHGMLMAADFGEELYSDYDNDLLRCWDAITSYDTVSRGEQTVYVPVMGNPPGPDWKKAIYYLMYDRLTLKTKVKERYNKRPVLLALMRFGYSIPRGVYHLFRGKEQNP